MMVNKWGSFAGALVLAAAGLAPVSAAQDRDPLVRLLDIAGSGTQIGAAVSDVAAGDAKQPKAGVLVETVTPGGPADKAGIKAGDAITEFDGERVRSVRQFSRLVQESSPGHAVPTVLSRGGQRVTVNVTPERRSTDDFETRFFDGSRSFRVPPTPPSTPRAPRPPAMLAPFDTPGGMRLWNTRGIGVTIESLDDQLAEYFGVKEGVLVKSVLNDSPAQKAGLKAGDVITAVDGRKIYDASDVNRAVDRVASSGEFTIEIVRDKKTQTLKGKLESNESRRVRTRTVL
jgi:serine protease Do